MKWKKAAGTACGAIVLAAAVFGAWRYYTHKIKERTIVTYKTAPVARQLVQSVITSTGTVEPEELVNVGAQVGGMITTFGVDSDGNQVDYRSPVKSGMVLAKIDDSTYVTARDTAKASLEEAEAKVIYAMEQAEAEYDLADREYQRAKALYTASVQSQSEYDTARTEFKKAEANLKLQKASIAQSEAQVDSAKAQLQQAEFNLGYCTIKSPVDGVVIDRRVNIGQTVNASMDAPSLFLLAKDLSRMQVWVSVNEADIGQIKVGGRVVFTVDTFPGKTFEGTVKKVRLNATMSQNVVTYIVEIDTDNSSGLLLPYLTANVDFILEERENALSVPNSALRFQPPEAAGVQSQRPAKSAQNEGLVWVTDDGRNIRPVYVKIGINDGSLTEILSGLEEGMHVVTGSTVTTTTAEKAEAEAKASAASSPFLPKPPPRPGSKKK